MIGIGSLSVSTFILFNSYIEQLKVSIANYANYKLMAVRYEETFKNTFAMLDDEELKSLKSKAEQD